MADGTKIEWTDASFNPIRARDKKTGAVGHYCEKTSKGCHLCYASAMQPRFHMPEFPWKKRESDIEVFLDEKVLVQPLHWKKPRMIFVCSMTDLFGAWVPDEWIDKIFSVMALCPQHIFQVLTKRAERMASFVSKPRSRFNDLGPLENVWFGVSVENQDQANRRIPWLLKTPAAVRWLSCEPLLESLDLSKWIGYNPVHEKHAQGRKSLRSGESRVVRDSSGRIDMANRAEESESLEYEHNRYEAGETASRGPGGDRVSSGEDHGGSSTELLSGSSPGMAPLLRVDSGRNNDQSQERRQDGQQTGEPGTGDAIGTDEARLQDGPQGRTRREKPGSEIEQSRGRGDSPRLRSRTCDTSEIGHGISRGSSDDFKDRERGTAPETEGSHSGLHVKSNSWDEAEKFQGSISLVICGGESGRTARPCQLEWIRSIIKQCREAGVPCFVKQLGRHVHLTSPGGQLTSWWPNHPKGGDMAEWEEDVRVREFPETIAKEKRK